jgi:anaerobic magnesium-protoporphyrin IX monomethyl ester cyclase
MTLKIMLINPKMGAQHPPLGLGYLSSYLKKYLDNPPEVRLFDEEVNDDLAGEVGRFNPDIIGISVVTPSFNRAVEICNIIKSLTDSPIVAGGVHITAVPESVMEAPFDVGVVGEGEETFLEIMRFFLKTHKVRDSAIAGIVYNQGGLMVRTPPRPLINNLDTIPPPDRRLFDMEHYIWKASVAYDLYAKGTSIMTSRGCPYNACTFCSSRLMWGNKVRHFSPAYVVSEMQSIIDDYRLNFIISLDDNFTTSKKWLGELAVLIEEKGINKKVGFDCESVSMYLDDERAGLLKKMGVIRVEFGFESGSPRVLSALKPGKTSVGHNDRAIEVCRRHNLMIVGNAICGYIDETPEELEESMDWYRTRQIDYVALHLYTPYPGTTGWNECIKQGILDPKRVDWQMFQTGTAERNVTANRFFPDGELDRRYKQLCDEFALRNKVVVFCRGLSLADRLRLYSKAAKAYKRSLIQLGLEGTMPWRYYLLGLAYPSDLKEILRRLPKLYSALVRLKSRAVRVFTERRMAKSKRQENLNALAPDRFSPGVDKPL